MAFGFGTTYGPTRLPAIDPAVLTALTGGFWNSVGGSPLMVGQKPNRLPQVMVNNQGQDLAAGVMPQANDNGIAALLKAFTAPRGHHFGIGGAEISEANPYGNPAGDPFKNGFFKQTPQVPMNYLGGTSFTGPDRVNEMALARIAPFLNPNRGPVAPLPIPAGDPSARAFWSKMGY